MNYTSSFEWPPKRPPGPCSSAGAPWARGHRVLLSPWAVALVTLTSPVLNKLAWYWNELQDRMPQEPRGDTRLLETPAMLEAARSLGTYGTSIER